MGNAAARGAGVAPHRFVRVDGRVPHDRWSAHGVTAVFTRRAGDGASRGPYAALNLGLGTGDDLDAVAANRRLVCDAAGLDASLVHTVRQVHGSDVWIEGAARAGAFVAASPPVEADALVSRSGAALAVLVADCVPVVIASPVVHAVVHAGWRSVVAGVIPAAIEAMRVTEGDGAAAAIGPALGSCCFEVGEDVAAQFDEACVIRRPGMVRPFVDLVGVVRDQLVRGGVARVDSLDRCTACDGRYFSHRRDSGTTGRQCVLAWRGNGVPPGEA